MLNFFYKDKGKVRYIVKGKPGTFNVTYQCGEKTHQFDEVKSGWKYSFDPCKSGYYYISAQANQKNASVTVRVYCKGKLIQEVINSGDYAIALASGTRK